MALKTKDKTWILIALLFVLLLAFTFDLFNLPEKGTGQGANIFGILGFR
jgi:hypothetical protein